MYSSESSPDSGGLYIISEILSCADTEEKKINVAKSVKINFIEKVFRIYLEYI